MNLNIMDYYLLLRNDPSTFKRLGGQSKFSAAPKRLKKDLPVIFLAFCVPKTAHSKKRGRGALETTFLRFTPAWRLFFFSLDLNKKFGSDGILIFAKNNGGRVR